jgi:hypothetical protein
MTIGLGLCEVNHGLLIDLLRAQEGQVIDVAGLILPPGKIERCGGGIFGGSGSFQTIGVLLERGQRVATF